MIRSCTRDGRRTGENRLKSMKRLALQPSPVSAHLFLDLNRILGTIGPRRPAIGIPSAFSAVCGRCPVRAGACGGIGHPKRQRPPGRFRRSQAAGG